MTQHKAMMTDLDMTRLCAEAVMLPQEFYTVSDNKPEHTIRLVSGPPSPRNNYWPLHDDAQAMALVKRLRLTIGPAADGASFASWSDEAERAHFTILPDLNRAIVECVAKMQATVTTEEG